MARMRVIDHTGKNQLEWQVEAYEVRVSDNGQEREAHIWKVKTVQYTQPDISYWASVHDDSEVGLAYCEYTTLDKALTISVLAMLG